LVWGVLPGLRAGYVSRRWRFVDVSKADEFFLALIQAAQPAIELQFCI
jgi:hypothetical protein